MTAHKKTHVYIAPLDHGTVQQCLAQLLTFAQKFSFASRSFRALTRVY